MRTHRPHTRNAFRLRLDVETDPDVAMTTRLAPLQELSPADALPPQVVVLGAESGALEVKSRWRTAAPAADRTEGVSRAVVGVLAALGAAGIRLEEPRALLIDGDEA